MSKLCAGVDVDALQLIVVAIVDPIERTCWGV